MKALHKKMWAQAVILVLLGTALPAMAMELRDPAEQSRGLVAPRDGAAIGDATWTAFHRATVSGNTALMEHLLLLGAQANATTELGENALHLCAQFNIHTSIPFLVELGVDIHATTLNGYAPLHTAAIYRSWESAAALLALNADVNAESLAGATPLTLAAQLGDLKGVELLRPFATEPNKRRALLCAQKTLNQMNDKENSPCQDLIGILRLLRS